VGASCLVGEMCSQEYDYLTYKFFVQLAVTTLLKTVVFL